MEDKYLMIQAMQPVQFSSAGRVETTKPFLHPTRNLDSYVLLIGIHGKMSIEQQGQPFDIVPGSTMLLKKDEDHRGLLFSDAPLSYYWFHFYLEDKYAEYLSHTQMNEQMVSMIQEPSSQTFSNHIYIPTFSKPTKIERLNILFNQLLDISQAGTHTYLAASYLMTSLLIELSNQTIESYTYEQKRHPSDHDLSHIIEWIRVHADQTQSVHAISDQFNYHPNYLSRQFKSQIGMSLQKYITLVKVTKAKDLLSRTRKSIRDISLSIGIEDEKYFMRLFKKSEGITPSEFRKAFYRIHLTDLEQAASHDNRQKTP
ncbi:AraC family transcriptional regulator [Alkalicoccobacillus murimartini]|uniref:YesN/AraC family two-component response regulator n=1 Tax=Alkalicoccobacillus murimartini TaxID=171685 RepID=A0ABT9YMP5_9BACI|nr:AraC family transcriptional regulator [Alkalicoccobacillus murimartini]MDQ0208755.1 YesN/AraC family two-component response regulator [Alkalicoccobacillus murimartini]